MTVIESLRKLPEVLRKTRYFISVAADAVRSMDRVRSFCRSGSLHPRFGVVDGQQGVHVVDEDEFRRIDECIIGALDRDLVEIHRPVFRDIVELVKLWPIPVRWVFTRTHDYEIVAGAVVEWQHYADSLYQFGSILPAEVQDTAWNPMVAELINEFSKRWNDTELRRRRRLMTYFKIRVAFEVLLLGGAHVVGPIVRSCRGR